MRAGLALRILKTELRGGLLRACQGTNDGVVQSPGCNVSTGCRNGARVKIQNERSNFFTGSLSHGATF